MKDDDVSTSLDSPEEDNRSRQREAGPSGSRGSTSFSRPVHAKMILILYGEERKSNRTALCLAQASPYATTLPWDNWHPPPPPSGHKTPHQVPPVDHFGERKEGQEMRSAVTSRIDIRAGLLLRCILSPALSQPRQISFISEPDQGCVLLIHAGNC
ncbi:hypothetical protein E1301_Tti008377 [Triplophysa tibetana]|uniref:Uncharacterized protein n=1 Tax=Triplophysa tibetana TaxID=1572043 RepID=A0A5A9PGE0_9TELE|nr:hypothetical protein E1301_Tti008377 [Triplophysa tibetana]